MAKQAKITTTTYDIGDDFYVDIVCNEESSLYEAWIFKKNVFRKDLLVATGMDVDPEDLKHSYVDGDTLPYKTMYDIKTAEADDGMVDTEYGKGGE